MDEHRLKEIWDKIDRGEDPSDIFDDVASHQQDIERMQTIDHMLKRTPLVEPPTELDDNIMSMVLKEEVADDIKEPSFLPTKDNMLSYVIIGFISILTIGVIISIIFRGKLEESSTSFSLDGLAGNSIYLYAVGLVILMMVFSVLSKGKTTTAK